MTSSQVTKMLRVCNGGSSHIGAFDDHAALLFDLAAGGACMLTAVMLLLLH